MSKLQNRLWPMINVAGILGMSAALILLLVSVLWQLGFADLTEIFPTLSPSHVIAGSAALGIGIWFRWNKARRGRAETG